MNSKLKILVNKALVARKANDHHLALKLFQDAYLNNPLNPNLPIQIAVEMTSLSFYKEALVVLKQAQYSNPASIWHQKGLINIAKNKKKEAINCFKSGIASNPNEIICYRSLFNLYLKDNDIDKATSIADEAIKSTKHESSYLLKAKISEFHGLLEQARIEYKATLENNSTYFNAQIALSRINIRLGYFNDADAILQKLLKIDPDHKPLILLQLMFLARSQYKIEDAYGAIRELLKNESSNPQYLSHKFYLDVMLGNSLEAKLTNKEIEGLYVINKTTKKESQNKHLYLLYKDMRTNAYAERVLNRITQLNWQDKPKKLANLLKEEPEHIGACLHLLISLKRCGVFDKKINVTPFKNQTKSIPQTIIQYWDQKKIPIEVQNYHQSWKIKNKNFEHKVFSYSQAKLFIKNNHSSQILKAFLACKNASMQADLFRLAYLYSCGGIYADSDDLCNDSLDDLFEDGIDLVLYQEGLGNIGNNFIMTTPHHQFIKFALEYASANIINEQGHIWFVSGPGMLSLAFCSYFNNELSKKNIPQYVRVLPAYIIERKITFHQKLKYKKKKTYWQLSQ